jgi:hypothetical protein
MRFSGFDPQQAFRYAKELSYPRLAGSEGEKCSAGEITARLEAAGCQVERLPFRFTTRAETFLKGGIAFGLVVVAGLVAAAQAGPHAWPLALLLSALLAGLLALLPRQYAARRARAVEAMPPGEQVDPEPGWPGRSVNLYAELFAEPDPDLPHLILMAHYDSKSQNLSLEARVILFSLTMLAGLSTAILSLLAHIWPAFLPVTYLAGLAAILAGMPLLFLRVENHSPGAIDNASGVGLVLHLAEVLAQQPGWKQRLRIGCLITSAEELGLLGALAFIQARGQRLLDQAGRAGVYVLNFDGIGIDGDLHLVGKPSGSRLESVLLAASQELGYCLKCFRLPGALFDHLPFAHLGLEAESLAAVGPASRTIHTRRDTHEKLHPAGFQRAGEVALAAISALISEEEVYSVREA